MEKMQIFNVSAKREFSAGLPFMGGDHPRDLKWGTTRDWSACFFTLAGGNHGCTKPSKMILSKNGGGSSFGGSSFGSSSFGGSSY